MIKAVITPNSRRGNMNILCSRNFLLFFLISTLILIVLFLIVIETWPVEAPGPTDHKFSLRNADNSEVVTVTGTPDAKLAARRSNCTFHSCVDVFKCGLNDETKLRVYVYPYKRYVDVHGHEMTTPVSRQFQRIMETVADSEYYTTDPNEACLFVPSVDLLNQESLDVEGVSRVLASLPHWNGGQNHLLFNMIPGSHPHYAPLLQVHTGLAMVAGASLSTWTYRRTFDVSIPEYNPLLEGVSPSKKSYKQSRQYQLISAQISLHGEYMSDLKHIQSQHASQFLLVDKCAGAEFDPMKRCGVDKEYTYPEILQESDFCLVVRGNRFGSPALNDALMQGCIPVVVSDGFIMPFEHVLDWTRAAVFVRENDLRGVIKVLSHYTAARVREMRRQAAFYWSTYFRSMRGIVAATLRRLNDRVFPHNARPYKKWNEKPNHSAVYNPLFLPLIPAHSSGFTAVILTYNRLESVFKVVRQVAEVASLVKVVVVWNNQRVAPPPLSSWPKISKPLRVIRTTHNRLSNRFYPYPDIETDCILALDDDIIMLSLDELEFGYQVWRENSDRIVGFPSRLHLWSNASDGWRYQSEWTNEISMVLTGAAFYHKYFGYLYTTKMPREIKTWVDTNMNCEDIAMNFVIANATGKSPIKVAPRKKFTCPTCASTDMLSTDWKHMLARSDCINRFAKIYESMPLKTAGFRADPVLYKDNITDILKLYRNIGSL